MNPASSTRSAAQATFSAYRRLPIRWRLAGGSAVLTLIILMGFAAIVGVFTQRRVYQDFTNQVSNSADDLQRSLNLQLDQIEQKIKCVGNPCLINDLNAYASSKDAAVRVVDAEGHLIAASAQTTGAPFFGPPGRDRIDLGGYRVETRAVPVAGLGFGFVWVQYARKVSDVKATVSRVRLILGLGVLGGAALALLAGLANARRAMRHVTRLTETARTIERTGDPSMRIPKPIADDEVRELADTLEDMLRSLDSARGETEAALGRQREFVADASHELRTPLTAVLANLELLEEELHGDQRETAAAALRSTRRMRRLVADLLLLARADAGRAARHSPTDLAEVLVEAAAELEPVAGAHTLTVEAEPGAIVDGARDELHRLALNLMDNALKHTAPGTAIRASVVRDGGSVELVVQDEGPGVPTEIAPRIFERFVRGSADRGGSSGLGLSIVRAVAETHGGSVALDPAARGARFIVRLPADVRGPALSAEAVRT